MDHGSCIVHHGSWTMDRGWIMNHASWMCMLPTFMSSRSQFFILLSFGNVAGYSPKYFIIVLAHKLG